MEDKEKSGKGLLITGIIFLSISIIFFGLFEFVFVDALINQNFSSAIGLIIGIIYLLIPGIIFSITSTIINLASFLTVAKKRRKKRVVLLIISLCVLILFAFNFLYLLLK